MCSRMDKIKLAVTSLNNINNKQNLEIVNFIEFKKLLNSALANYDG